MRNGMLITAITMIALSVPSTAHAQFGDPARVPLGGVVEVREAIGDASHPPAFLNGTSVEHQDVKGKWHRFRFDGLTLGARLVPLEDGGGMAVWQNASSIYAQRWHRGGSTDVPQTVLTGVADLGYASHGGTYYPQWDLSFDRHGAVVIAGVGQPGASAGAIYAVTREPGGASARHRSFARRNRPRTRTTFPSSRYHRSRLAVRSAFAGTGVRAPDTRRARAQEGALTLRCRTRYP